MIPIFFSFLILSYFIGRFISACFSNKTSIPVIMSHQFVNDIQISLKITSLIHFFSQICAVKISKENYPINKMIFSLEHSHIFCPLNEQVFHKKNSFSKTYRDQH